MIKRFILVGIMIASFYVFFLMLRLNINTSTQHTMQGSRKQEAQSIEQPSQKVYSFSFSKYTSEGHRELEIEGDSADIFAKIVTLSNVIAKAYADDKPITITADKGVFDKSTSNIHLAKNVVATSEEGTTLRSDTLDIDITHKILSTEDRAQVEKDNIKLEGKGAHGDSNLKKIKFKKNVTVVISSEDEGASPTIITCDGSLDVDYVNNIARFNDNVIATDERGKLSADSMDVFYDKASRRVYKIIARGNVIIEQEGNVTYSDNVIYLAKEGRIILGGDPEAIYYPESEPFKEVDDDDKFFIFESPMDAKK